MSNPIVGSSRILRAFFTDPDGLPVDPAVILFIRDPSGDITSPVPTNPADGTYEHEVTLDEDGWWEGQWEGTSVDGTEICTFKICVDASAFAGVS